ncbi:MAG: SMP-30/gluconolactonase/LRE family protein [Nannocystaceae bacterium]|nr:SMP-30/gluconolactonase/LRE family protein [Nannocystaceae bacterium]
MKTSPILSITLSIGCSSTPQTSADSSTGATDGSQGDSSGSTSPRTDPPSGTDDSTTGGDKTADGTTGSTGSRTDSRGTQGTTTTGRGSTDADGTDSTTTEDSGSSSSGDSSGSSDTGPEAFDCAMAPETPVSVQLLSGPRGYHGLVITDDGRMIGSDGVSLMASTYDGRQQLLLPGIGQGQQMDWLPDGDFAFSTDANALSRVGTDGTTNVIRPNIAAYGVVTGPDGMVYVNTGLAGGRIGRVDPGTGDLTLLFDGVEDQQAHSLGFSPDWSRMYVGTASYTEGTIFYADLDGDMNPTTGLQVLSTDADNGEVPNGYYDGIAVDACGTLYVTDYYSSSIYRITADGTTTLYWEPDSSTLYAHGLVWGSGSDGWMSDALYLPQPYNENSVTELVVGVPSREFAGVVVNAPIPL